MLAIVIPYYKITFFEATLISLANQTDKRFKVYIGNDASSENPTVLLKKYKEALEFSYYEFKENLGEKSLTKQWERCINLIENEPWIMILGDDDMLEPNVVASFYKWYATFNKQSNLVRFSTKIIFNESQKISKKFEHPKWETAANSYYRKLIGQTRSSLSEYAFSKKSYIKYGFYNYPLAWGSDSRAWLDFPEEKLIFSINEAVVLIRFSNINISGKTNNISLKNQASVQLLKNVIDEKLSIFNKKQRLLILLEYEVVIKQLRQLKLYEYLMLAKYYFKNFEIISFTKFTRRVFLNIFKIS